MKNKLILKFNRIGENYDPADMTFEYDGDMPNLFLLENAVRVHLKDDLPGARLDTVFASTDTEAVNVSIALNDGDGGYAVGNVLPAVEPPC